MTSDTKASERGLSSSDSRGGEIPKKICDAARKEVFFRFRDEFKCVLPHLRERAQHAGHHAPDPAGPLSNTPSIPTDTSSKTGPTSAS